jgi:glycosyltransferase involved in cell wall biosynthesis
MLAPPWIPIPPDGYGGIELVVHKLCDALVRRGHDVVLYAAPGSRSSAEVRSLLPSAHPDEIERALYECDHVARAFTDIERECADGRPFDIVHDHCGFTAFAMADRIDVPVVHTLHGPFTPETYAFYEHHRDKAAVVAISRAQLRMGPPGLRVAGVAGNPIDVREWPYVERKDDYLLWVGRMTEEKGPHRAIEVARRAGCPLVIAGPVQTGQEVFFEHEVEPHVDGTMVRYLGEVGGELKRRLFAGARALLMPIRWPEPFGMVMVEALACGTPVLAFRQGSAAEIVEPGVNGFLVDDELEMARAVEDARAIHPERCRYGARTRFGQDRVAAAYEAAYRLVIEEARLRAEPAPARAAARVGGTYAPGGAGRVATEGGQGAPRAAGA